GLFGANAAWWTLMILALNLNAARKRLVLGKGWVTKRMKALRFHLIGLPGRVVSHARKLIIRLGAGAEALRPLSPPVRPSGPWHVDRPDETPRRLIRARYHVAGRPSGGQASPWPADKNVTHNSCTTRRRDSPCVRRDKQG
ncbi:MAG TPA: hypothetical protein VKG25_28560, partial [Bryobacteraceae bacterium]|nr:hypothetical protein [Bryobacteraceae bacterium]